MTSFVLLTLGQYRSSPSTTYDGQSVAHQAVRVQNQNTNLFGKSGILFQELHDTIGELRVIHAQALDFVQRYQDSGEKELVLLFEGQCKAVDDRSEDFQQLGDTVEPFGLIDELEEHIVDGSADVGTEIEEFAVYSMQSGL